MPPTTNYTNPTTSNEILIMAMTRMVGGICTAGFSTKPHRESKLQWVRPVKRFGTLLLDDVRDEAGHVIAMGDVVQFNLQRSTPNSTHCEDCLTDFIERPPRILRQLTADKRADFLATHCDQNPAAVLHAHVRSLCLIRPNELWATIICDSYTGNYQTRLGFRLAGQPYPSTQPERGLPVTDLKWRALGRQWLTESGAEQLSLDHTALHQRLGADIIYLSIGLSRAFEGKTWTLVIGVHPVPDYTTIIHYDQP
ncbi:MAG: hypothetical protein KDE53_04280 [Caldilineaceae bacterium]|nr:hypothetical protein [Caldilineaceae bacterium]MCB0121634.1 hypothetical protein [Caldilineaceae bacterium]MCB0186799.1 hypothetical protein [Caldilineaceae bacterium]